MWGCCLVQARVCTGSMHGWRTSVHAFGHVWAGESPANPHGKCSCSPRKALRARMNADGCRAECLVPCGKGGMPGGGGAGGRLSRTPTPWQTVWWRSDKRWGVSARRPACEAVTRGDRPGAAGTRIEIRRAPLATPQAQQILGLGGRARGTRFRCSA